MPGMHGCVPAPMTESKILNNLAMVLLLIFGGVALMVVLGERFAKPADPERMRQLRRWLIPLVGLMLVLSVADFYL